MRRFPRGVYPHTFGDASPFSGRRVACSAATRSRTSSATFSILPVIRDGRLPFVLNESRHHDHQTPWGVIQKFQFTASDVCDNALFVPLIYRLHVFFLPDCPHCVPLEIGTRMLHLGKFTTFRFGVSLAIVLSILFAVLQFSTRAPSPLVQNLADGRLHVFFLPDCPHCHDAIEFLKTQSKIDFVLHDVSTRANQALLSIVAGQHGISAEDLGVPFFVFGSNYLMGFDSAETTGRELLALVVNRRQSRDPMPRAMLPKADKHRPDGRP